MMVACKGTATKGGSSMKKKQSREKATPIQDKDLVSAKGSSGYNQTSGREDGDPNPEGPP